MNSEVNFSADGVIPLMIDNKSDHVREVFENASHYLNNRGVDIRFRVDTVREFAAKKKWSSLLDIGCGDGSISLQLLNSSSHLTLLDLSTSMVALAMEKVPENLAANVTIRNGNFMTTTFDEQSFDLIVTVGVMAHVDSPDAFLGKIRNLLRPDASLIVEFTDCYHAVGAIGRFWGRLKEVAAPAKYSTNRLSFADVAPLFEKHGLKLESVFRYSRIPFPGIDRLVPHGLQYRFAKWMFGSSLDNRNANLGNEYICLLSVAKK
jgi:ubiquinone/menaquinone biosynthesis C-methylase UbiE